MKLSVIIVNYNVKHFLEQCLLSVEKAIQGIEGEVIVVDNNSVDGSCQLVRNKFPQVLQIENSTNAGFSKANNQGIRLAKGEFVLLLNPDTIVEKTCFAKCLAFLDEHPDVGALGVKMIDGNGRFLPESKRGLPTPWVAFCKIAGLTRIFPHSYKFARYYLGHLPTDAPNEVEILAGAFMLLRKSALLKTGLLDESFFMYGEDIDLSYRIRQNGFKNYYFPETTIIHYKGESTRKGSLNYVKLFYKAMLIFSKKHFSNRQNVLFNLFIKLAIYFRATLSVFSRALSIAAFPVLDGLLIFTGFYLLIPFWEKLQFEANHFPSEYLLLLVPVYLAIWLIAISLAKGYCRPFSIKRLIRGILAGSLVIMLVYSFLNENWRFSRSLILLGSAWTIIVLPLLRYLLSLTGKPGFELEGTKTRQILLMAGPEEALRIGNLLQNSRSRFDLQGLISPTEELPTKNYLGKYSQVRQIIRVHRPDELIFSGRDVASATIIDCMLDLNQEQLQFKIAPDESMTIIGGHSPNSTNELLPIDINPLSNQFNRLLKRWFDLKLACLLLFFYPFLFWTFDNRRHLRKNCVAVVRNQKTWIGFASSAEIDPHLPLMKPGILTTSTPHENQLSEMKKLGKDRLYAKNYRFLTDLELVFLNWKKLGR